jgi:type II secretory ATPase GspE/PulE/Tfp pilus assembly ATPase PilB-like protein
MEVSSDQLSDFLFDAGLISRGDLARARSIAEEEGKSLAEVLVEGGMVGDDDVRRTLARALGVPFVVFENQPLDEEVLMLLPEPMSRSHNAVAIGARDNRLEVAFLDTHDIESIQTFFGDAWTVVPRLTTRASMKYALVQYQRALRDLFGARITEELRAIEQSQRMGDRTGSTNAAVRAVDALLHHALQAKAREMHIEPSVNGVRIRYRLGNALYDAMNVPVYAAPLLGARLKSLSQIPLTSAFGTGRFKMNTQGAQNETVTVTLSTNPVISESGNNERIALSFIYENVGRQGLSLSTLGVAPHNIETIQGFLGHTSGLILVCGVEGSGKTSMLYTLLDESAAPSKHIATVEDSVSYVLPTATQMEVDESLGLNAVSCARAQLRHNPDILMIDAALTEELVFLAAQAANRGSLVLLGVHAVTAGEGMAQLAALGVPLELLATVCIGSIGVHTMSRLCSYKTARYKPTRVEQTLLENTIDIKDTIAVLKNEQILDSRTVWKDIELQQPTPCSQCQDGLSGLVGLQEVVPMSLMFKEGIREGADVYALEIQARRDGVLTLAEDALYKAIQGIISADGVLEVAAGYQARYS